MTETAYREFIREEYGDEGLAYAYGHELVMDSAGKRRLIELNDVWRDVLKDVPPRPNETFDVYIDRVIPEE